MKGTGYWIDKFGRIIDSSNDKHIHQIIENPREFGFKPGQVEDIFKKHNERIGTEGKAREEIIEEVLKNGLIRVRLYPNSYWSVTLYDWNRYKSIRIKKWANKAKKEKTAGKYMPVKILDMKTDRFIVNGEEIGRIANGSLDEHVDILCMNFGDYLNDRRN